MPEAHIKEGNILELKAFIMSKGIFDQLREARDVGADETKIIGWVRVGYLEWYIGQLGTQVVKVSRMELFERLVREIGREEIIARAESTGTTFSIQMNAEIDKFRDDLPQIFIK